MTAVFDLAPGERWQLSERSLLLGAANAFDAQRIAAHLQRNLSSCEVIVGLSSLLVEWNELSDESDLHGLLDSLEMAPSPLPGRHHEVEVVLDGDDLEEARARTGMTIEEIGNALEAQHFRVACVGFSPGFGYLTGLSGPLASLPRRSSPRPRVPSGSFAVAAGYCAVYPQASPGGWWLLGRSNAQFFDTSSPRPSLLVTGDLVSVRIVDHLSSVQNHVTRTVYPPAGATPALRVLNAPPGTSVVDDGRRGLASVGVGPTGPFDPERARIVRQLLGGTPGALELVGSGLMLEVLTAVTVAGIDLHLRVDGRQVPSEVPLELVPGQRLEATAFCRGPRGYLGVAGGPLIEPVLGSMSTCSLSGVGPGYLEPGDVLGVASPSRGGSRADSLEDASAGRLRVLRGPHHESIQGGLTALVSSRFTVTGPINRVGIRLARIGGSFSRSDGSLSSLPVATGVIQMPPDGQPVILGPDHATLGGYPIVATVIEADLARVGRLTTGDHVWFEEVTIAEALELKTERDLAIAHAVTGAAVRLGDSLI